MNIFLRLRNKYATSSASLVVYVLFNCTKQWAWVINPHTVFITITTDVFGVVTSPKWYSNVDLSYLQLDQELAKFITRCAKKSNLILKEILSLCDKFYFLIQTERERERDVPRGCLKKERSTKVLSWTCISNYIR